MLPQGSRTALVIFGCAGVLLTVYWPRAINEQSLSQQLAGAHCRYAHDHGECRQRGVEPLRRLFTEDHDCDLWAIKCLAEMQTPEAVDVMITVLKTKTDVQTCDGVRPIRTQAVTYLGNSKDLRALAPLRAHLTSKPK